MTRMVTVGHIELFNLDNKQIAAYLERVELFFIANGVKEDKQVVTLYLWLVAKLTPSWVTC